MWDQNSAVGRGVRHHQLSSTVADTTAEVEGSEMVGRTVKGHQSEGRQTLFDEREEGDSVEKKQGKG